VGNAKSTPAWAVKQDQVETTPMSKDVILGELKRLKNGRVIDISMIAPDLKQPRKHFDQEHLEYLAASLKEHGQLQPITVVRDSESREEKYVIQMGERRWRAARIAGLETLDCIVEKRKLSEDDLRIRQYVENEIRQGLTPLEKAHVYQRMIEQTGCSLADLADMFKTSKGNVSKTLSVLKLTVEEQHMATGLATNQIYEVSKLEDPIDRRNLINKFATKQVTTADLRKNTATQKTINTKKKRTVDGATIYVQAPIRLSNAEVAIRLRKFADHLQKDGRSAAA